MSRSLGMSLREALVAHIAWAHVQEETIVALPVRRGQLTTMLVASMARELQIGLSRLLASTMLILIGSDLGTEAGAET